MINLYQLARSLDKNCFSVIYIHIYTDDQVFMPETAHLSEYILNETGKIYSGSYKRISPKPWNFGQVS